MEIPTELDTEINAAREPVLSPLGDRIIVEAPVPKLENDDLQMIGTLYVPPDANMGRLSRWNEAIGKHHVVKALAAGPDCKRVKAGDSIVVTDQGLFYVNSEGVKFCACMEASVVAIVE